MKRKLFFILSLFLIYSIFVFAENFPQKAKTVNDFVPRGWKILKDENGLNFIAKGDLNKDKLEDIAIIIEKDDKKNIKKNDGFGPEELNLNPRILLVLFKGKDGTYSLAAKNDKGFIKSEGNEDNSALMDTLDNIIIKNNVLKIVFNYFMSAGSWWTSTDIYIFRFQNNVFELIGYESNAYMRNTGEEEGTSINFSTNKAKITTGGNIFEEKENNPKDEWRYLKFEKKYILDEMTESTLDEILDIVY
ncbi:hypothetical protein [Fusobacterium canifelinum]|uniref:VCBS repeat-containing protein n=1 Tax=Fusobacterium canifelinum TaxID=285729 RepID=A0A3P1V7R5_9FUSO|nr:hypothetical protein [Fusobacterium canifelinum]RRD28663.1 hypothetical protein EII27_00215 [Fusobacterium canifelinum]